VPSTNHMGFKRVGNLSKVTQVEGMKQGY